MDEQTLTQICSLYSLGPAVAPPERMTGGLTHRLYRVRTPRGSFAVKLLSADALAETGFRAQVRQGERIAAAVAAAGLPAVAAHAVAGEPLLTVGAETVLVYPWVEGQALSSFPAGHYRAGKIGTILGQMHHRLSLPSLAEEIPPPVVLTFTEAEWADMADQACHTKADWAEPLAAALPYLARWGNRYTEAQQTLAGRWTLSHGDLHQQNVLWTDEDTPWLIDWESAGWQQPAKEAVVCALEWSGFVEGDPDLPTFRAFLDAYRRASPGGLSNEEALHGLDACFGNWLGWLRFCTQRALATTTEDATIRDPLTAQERKEAARQVVGTLATIRRVESILPALRSGCVDRYNTK